MDSKVIGFIGIECYDLMLYIAKMLLQLKCSALLVDASYSQSLSYVFQGDIVPNEYLDLYGVDLLAGVDFFDPSLAQGYDYTLVYFGFDQNGLQNCDELYIVTDYQRHNMAAIRTIDPGNICRFLVVRDRAYYNWNSKSIVAEFPNLEISVDDIYSIEDSETDVSLRIALHHSAKLNMKKVSLDIKEFVLHVLDVDFDAKTLESAWKSVIRRK